MIFSAISARLPVCKYIREFSTRHLTRGDGCLLSMSSVLTASIPTPPS